MATINQVCAKCGRQFLVIDQEQEFLSKKGISFPTSCPSCRQLRRLSLRGGERALYKTKCQQCGKEIITSFDPNKTPNKILCKEDYEKYFSENEALIADPLPQD
jgi:DNA-directed RNA polymerase subunit RPC12/RpoP